MSKRADIIEMLSKDWVAAPALLEKTGWKSHTLRGVLSTLGSKEKLKIERRRADGVTSYRVVPG